VFSSVFPSLVSLSRRLPSSRSALRAVEDRLGGRIVFVAYDFGSCSVCTSSTGRRSFVA
jgi:hypothetical protein